MLVNYLLLYFQIALLGLVIICEMVKHNQKNIFAIVMSSLIIILLSGQGLWVINNLEVNNIVEMVHIYQRINTESVDLACVYSSFYVIAYYVVYVITSKKKQENNFNSLRNKYIIRDDVASYALISIFFFISSTILIISGGGIVSSILAPGMKIC